MNVDPTDASPEFVPFRQQEHPTTRRLGPVRLDPMSSVRYTGTSLLYTSLSGRLFLYDVAASPDATLAGSYESVREWACAKGTFTLHRTFPWIDPGPSSSTVSAATGGGSSRVVRTGTPAVWALCCQIDKWRVLAGGSDGSCVVWNHFTGKRVYKLKGPTLDKGGCSKTLRPTHPRVDEGDGDEEGGGDGTVAVKAITGVAFDDERIYAGGMDGWIRVWECIDTNNVT
ncbi:hypothetical protein HKX48_001413 [Thoreauomyces humboldtii]|nr:hypothetical protein HKX48_001413 [Thoreauomyces humboldtii]